VNKIKQPILTDTVPVPHCVGQWAR